MINRYLHAMNWKRKNKWQLDEILIDVTILATLAIGIISMYLYVRG